MASLIIKSITANPVRISLTLNGQGYTLEYPNKQAALDALGQMPDTETQVELALLFVLKKWKLTDPNLTNLAGLVNKTCTIALPVVSIT
jgi:hypothetical protein